MPYEARLSPEEKVVDQINQDLAGKAFLFWRKFAVTLTNKRLHAYQKFIVSHGQKTFDLRDIDSIHQEKRFNGGYSFFLGLFVYFIMFFFGLIAAGSPPNATVTQSFTFGGFILWALVFILYFFKRVLVVKSRNDNMSIDVIRMPERKLGDFVQSVLQQKDTVLATPASSTSSAQSGNAADRIKQLSDLRSQGLITEQEFETKRQDILKSF